MKAPKSPNRLNKGPVRVFQGSAFYANGLLSYSFPSLCGCLSLDDFSVIEGYILRGRVEQLVFQLGSSHYLTVPSDQLSL